MNLRASDGVVCWVERGSPAVETEVGNKIAAVRRDGCGREKSDRSGSRQRDVSCEGKEKWRGKWETEGGCGRKEKSRRCLERYKQAGSSLAGIYGGRKGEFGASLEGQEGEEGEEGNEEEEREVLHPTRASG